MQPRVRVKILRAPHAAGLPLPAYQTDGSTAADVVAAVENTLTLKPGERALVPTGFHYELPPGYEIQVRPRSGLAANHGVGVVNGPGTLDSDYRGELKVILINHGQQPVDIKRGERIAQIVVAPVTRAAFEEAAELGKTARGSGGFGSTGRA